jgi:hypothetical protein
VAGRFPWATLMPIVWPPARHGTHALPDNPFTLADLALALVVGILALVPAAIALLALAALLRAFDAEQRLGRLGFRVVAGTLGLLIAGAFLLLAWTWGGATHLKPRCLARAEPDYARVLFPGGDVDRAPAPVPVSGLRVDAPGEAPPAWAAALLGPGGFPFYEWRRADGTWVQVAPDGTQTPIASPSAGALLKVRRASAESSYWARITVDRFLLTDLATGSLLADGEEMWVDAGPARYRCGIASGPYPVPGRDYPEGYGVARFLGKAVRWADGR